MKTDLHDQVTATCTHFCESSIEIGALMTDATWRGSFTGRCAFSVPTYLNILLIFPPTGIVTAVAVVAGCCVCACPRGRKTKESLLELTSCVFRPSTHCDIGRTSLSVTEFEIALYCCPQSLILHMHFRIGLYPMLFKYID